MYYYWNDVTHPIMAVIIFLDFFQKFHDSILCRFGSLSLSLFIPPVPFLHAPPKRRAKNSSFAAVLHLTAGASKCVRLFLSDPLSKILFLLF